MLDYRQSANSSRAPVVRRSSPSFSIPQGNGHLTIVLVRGGEEFEPFLAGVGKLNRKFQVFPVDYKYDIF